MGLNLQVAVKVDKDTVVKSLNREIQVLKRLQNKTYFCKIYDCGKIDDGRSFCVMELLGCNLAKWKQDKKLELHEILKICRELLLAIREMHINGYVHRDIKPANFARRVQHKSDWSTWALFDFGLGRRIVGRDEEMLKERIGIGFRGSVSYASVNAHEQKDLSFRDDLWSWMYIMIELLKGAEILLHSFHNLFYNHVRHIYLRQIILFSSYFQETCHGRSCLEERMPQGQKAKWQI